MNNQANFDISLYNDVWMDNAIENFYRILKGMASCEITLHKDSLRINITDIQEFINELTLKILVKRENMIVIEEDKKTGTKKEIKKDYIIIQEEKKIGGKVSLKEDLYKLDKTKEIIADIFKSLLGKEKNRCVLCGRTYEYKIKNLQQASYPMVTKIASLSGVRSYKDGIKLSLKDYYDNVCPLCYLLGILEWTDEGVVYRTFPGDFSLLFMPIFDNLKDLHDFKNYLIYAGLLNKNSRYSNIRVHIDTDDVENTPGEYSTLLCFYEKFIENATNVNIAKQWAVIRIPFGAVKNIRVDLITIDEGILQIIKDLKEEGLIERIYTDLFKKVFFYSSQQKSIDWDLTRSIQEKLSQSFLYDDFKSFVYYLLPRKGGYVSFFDRKYTRKYFEDLVYIWRWKKMGVPKEKLKSIKSVGNIIAKICESNVSLLYKMDKTRTIEEFWSVLREIARKLPNLKDKQIKEIEPEDIDAIDETIILTKELVESNKDAWKEIRDLIVIYAAMYYSISKIQKQKNGGG